MRKIRLIRLKGVTIIEFTLIVLAVLMLIFFAFEMGRYVFTMQMLNEMTRKASRLAAVCTVDINKNIRDLSQVVENRPINFESENLEISYLDLSGDTVGITGYENGTQTGDTIVSQIRYVKSEVINYQFQLTPLLSFLGDSGKIDMPSFSTILPSESLGIIRNNEGNPTGAWDDCEE